MSAQTISLITVCYNAKDHISACIESVLLQNYQPLEYIVIDGGSTDGTMDIVNQYKERISIIVSERDHGIYDAMNKGITLATGDIIGTLNSDDTFHTNQVLTDIAVTFGESGADVVYGDLDFISSTGKVTRKWRSGLYKPGAFNFGWMPAHPTFYCRKKLFEEFGTYRLDLGSAADYELMLRFIHKHHAKVKYLNKVLVDMTIGGISNGNLLNRFKAMYFDYKAMKKNKLRAPLLTLLLKPTRKVSQYF